MTYYQYSLVSVDRLALGARVKFTTAAQTTKE